MPSLDQKEQNCFEHPQFYSSIAPMTRKLRSHMKGMAKIKLVYSGAMAQILPRLKKDIVHFVVYGYM